ncbi:MAG: DNA translocase FtsK [Rikenellaceae bacterium]|nr:DNA translocase FtsK [Rikenellaceae bacterium]
MATAQKGAMTPSRKKNKKGLTETQRWVCGAFVFTFGLFLLAAIGSYYFKWSYDQNFVEWGDIWRSDAGAVSNHTGKTGAVMAHFIVGKWFGLFGIAIPVILIILGLRIIDYRPAALRKSVRITLLVMIAGSLTLGFIFGTRWDIFGTGLGGMHGIVVSRWIASFLGVVGTALLLLLIWVLIGVYINGQRTISAVNKVGKGIFDQSVKVGGAVMGHAAELVGGKADDILGVMDEIPQNKDTEDISVTKDSDITEVTSGEPPYGGPQKVMEIAGGNLKAADPDIFEITDTRIADEETVVSGKVSDLAAIPEVVTLQGEVLVPIAIENQGEIGIVDNRYAGGVGEFSGQYAPDEIGDIRDKDKAVAEHDPAGVGIEVVDLHGGTPLSIGGVVEAAAKGGVTTGDRLEVVVAGHSDAELSQEEIDDRLYDPTLELSKYQKPPVELLEDHSIDVQVTEEEIYENKNRIVRTLENFGIKIDKIKATIGPTVTLYEIVPAAGVKISKIKNLEDDIALSLKALGIRIIAPMPGKGTVGIEVPNKDKEIVSMYSVVRTMKFQESGYELPVVLGKTISNETFIIDLAKMPHLLVAGSTGQGKSVGLNAIITSLLYRKHPAELKFVLVDPKRVELSLYSKLERHFLAKMESEQEAILTDTQKVVYTLNSLCQEMSERYELLRLAEVKKLSEYNEKFLKRRLNPRKGHRYMPYIVVVIDEFADMIMTAGREVEAPITRLAQLARAVGIHLVIATQRPDVKVITGLIKANFPARIAFRVMSMVDSRTIIDQPGANQLIGRGDMLMSLNGELTRVQCAFIDTPEIERITEFIGNQKGYAGPYELPDYQPDADASGQKPQDLGQIDAMFEDVARFVVQNQQGSTSSIQRRFSIGYNRAGRIMDQLEAAGIVGRAEGSKPREVLITDVASMEFILSRIERDGF